MTTYGIISRPHYFSKHFGTTVIFCGEEETRHAKEKTTKTHHTEEHSVHRRYLQWCGYKPGEFDGLCAKVEQLSVQRSIKKYRSKVKDSSMK